MSGPPLSSQHYSSVIDLVHAQRSRRARVAEVVGQMHAWGYVQVSKMADVYRLIAEYQNAQRQGGGAKPSLDEDLL